MLGFLLALAAPALTTPALTTRAFQAPDEPSGPLGDVTVVTGPIFTDDEARTSWLRRTVNATHWTTREAVVRREIWKRRGETVDGAFADELERNLRALGLFAEAEVELVPRAGSKVIDLVVRTKDRLTISGGASGSFVGNVASGGFSLSESNLFGTGDRLSFGFFENDEDEFRGSVAYRDRYLFGTWTSATAEAGRTDQGDFAGLRVDRPFRYLADSFSWGVSARTAEAERDYFFRGDTVTEVPFDETGGGARATWREGTRFDFVTYGVAADHRSRAFGTPRGAAIERVPGDTDATHLRFTASATRIERFEKVTGLDTIRFVQDVRLGTTLSGEAGVTIRDEDGRGTESQPTFSTALTTAHRLAEDTYLSAAASASARLFAGDAMGWTSRVDLRAYQMSLPNQTLAFGARLVNADESQGLPVQLTLGEDSGLRGYPRREFDGDRILRLNLEDRWDTGLQLGAFDVGAVAFADLGWASRRGEGFGAPLRTVGIGLRIGSNELLGRGVVRIDLSFPLDERDGIDYDPLLSITAGQVFRFQ